MRRGPRVSLSVGLMAGLAMGQVAEERSRPVPQPCPVVTATIWQAGPGKPESQPRVEIRRCGEDSWAIFLVGFLAGSKEPDLVIDTWRSFVHQMLVAGSVFVFQLRGASLERIREDGVFILRAGRRFFEVVGQYYTKGPVLVSSDGREVSVKVMEGERVLGEHRLEAEAKE